MIVETDVDALEEEFFLCIELEITEKQIKFFNNKGIAYLVHRNPIKNESERGKFTEEPHLMLWKIWEDEDPTENLAPFTSKQEAINVLITLWQFCGNTGHPKIQEKQITHHRDPWEWVCPDCGQTLDQSDKSSHPEKCPKKDVEE